MAINCSIVETNKGENGVGISLCECWKEAQKMKVWKLVGEKKTEYA
jgi:hypothetical protein